MAQIDEWKVGGYQFGSKEDAELARQEEKKIGYLEGRMRYDHPEMVLGIYNKLIEQRVFQTPVGFAYLQKLSDYLKQSGLDEQASSIPLFQIYNRKVQDEIKPRLAERRVMPTQYSILKGKLRTSVLVNIMLIILVILMFVITVKSDNPNILNYKHALENKYASWEQDLSEREKVIREKERELNIQSQDKENN